jgi:replicative superfamily II helicase
MQKSNDMKRSCVKKHMGLHSLVCVVIDELHLLGNDERGLVLEGLLTKLLFYNGNTTTSNGNMTASNENATTSNGNTTTSNGTTKPPLQLIGLSATLPNLDAMAKWMNATLYITHFRPVQLLEMIKVGNVLFEPLSASNSRLLRTLPSEGAEGPCPRTNPNHLVTLCEETVREKGQVLVFCPYKASPNPNPNPNSNSNSNPNPIPNPNPNPYPNPNTSRRRSRSRNPNPSPNLNPNPKPSS